MGLREFRGLLRQLSLHREEAELATAGRVYPHVSLISRRHLGASENRGTLFRV